jgi:hypothetical protein
MATDMRFLDYGASLTGVHTKEPIVQQLVGQLPWEHYVLPLTNIKDAGLNYMHQQLEIAEYKLAQSLPDDLKGSLPTIEEFEKEFGDLQEVEDDE